MSEETKINLNYMLQIAESISQKGYMLSERFEKLLFHIKTMQEYWQGEFYMDFVKKVNKILENFTEISVYYTEKFPKELTEKRNLYAIANNEMEAKPQLCSAITLNKIIVREQGDTIIYKSSAMKIKINRVYDIFDDIKMNLNGIEDDFKSIVWEDTIGTLVNKEFDENIFLARKTLNLIRQTLQDDLIARHASNGGS